MWRRLHFVWRLQIVLEHFCVVALPGCLLVTVIVRSWQAQSCSMRTMSSTHPQWLLSTGKWPLHVGKYVFPVYFELSLRLEHHHTFCLFRIQLLFKLQLDSYLPYWFTAVRLPAFWTRYSLAPMASTVMGQSSQGAVASQLGPGPECQMARESSSLDVLWCCGGYFG